MTEINNWDVLKEMGERNSSKIEMASLDNIVRINYYANRGTEVTVGVSGNRTFAFERGEYYGGLLLADKKEFETVKAELEKSSGGQRASQPGVAGESASPADAPQPPEAERPGWLTIAYRLIAVGKLPHAERCYCCWWAKDECPHCPKNKSGRKRLLEDPKGATPMQDCECEAFARQIAGLPPRDDPKHKKIPEVTAQQILDAGLNLFGLQLFIESVAGKTDAKTFSPLIFLHRGVKITLEPSGDVDTRHH